jgi:DNA-binding response OmpR family regulator
MHLDEMSSALASRLDGWAPPGLVLSGSRQLVWVGEQSVRLTRLEFALLAVLQSGRGRVHCRAELLKQVWLTCGKERTRTVDTHIKRLRQKLGRARGCIETVRGVGYRFNGTRTKPVLHNQNTEPDHCNQDSRSASCDSAGELNLLHFLR